MTLLMSVLLGISPEVGDPLDESSAATRPSTAPLLELAPKFNVARDMVVHQLSDEGPSRTQGHRI